MPGRAATLSITMCVMWWAELITVSTALPGWVSRQKKLVLPLQV